MKLSNKPKFNEIMQDPEYADYINNLLEKAMVKKMASDELDIDTESYEEMRSLAEDLGDSISLG